MNRKELKKTVKFILIIYSIVLCTHLLADTFTQSVYASAAAADLEATSDIFETDTQAQDENVGTSFKEGDCSEAEEGSAALPEGEKGAEGDAKPQPEPETEPELQPEAESEPQPEPETELEPQLKPETESEPQPETELQPETESEPQPEPVTQLKPEPELAMVDEPTLYAEPRAASITLNSYNGGGSIVLTEDVTAYYQCQLYGSLTIDLKGHTMTMANQGSFMLMSDKASLTIRDSKGGGTIYACGQLIWCYSGGTVNLYGGTLDGSKATAHGQNGGCVLLSSSNMGNSAFNMYGGTIQNFEATQYGGAVCVGHTFSEKKPVFTMYGGTIKDCYAPQGAAVYVEEGGDGPGYFYIKGGAKKAEGGESRVTIRCVTYPEKTVSNAIFCHGYFGLEGAVDIDGIVYLEQNNWASSDKRFIKITGRLTVLGDGYIDVDSAYPNKNAVCTGHTVVANATRTEGTGPEIPPEEFYTYSSFFVNKTKGLLISGGFDPRKNELDEHRAPANWPTGQGDMLTKKYEYVDAMGQTMLVQAMDSPGERRLQQNYDYLIYTERADLSKDYAEYYSFKISKKDLDTSQALDGVTFSLNKQIDKGNGEVGYELIGKSGATGDYDKNGVESGETYIYLDADMAGKLMADDGIYVLNEESAPEGYVLRKELAVIHIYHKIDESTGKPVSVVEITANNKVLTTEEQVIDSTYGDTGKILNREIVLLLHNSTRELNVRRDYKIQIKKYADAGYTVPLAGAGFVLCQAADDSTVAAQGSSDEKGMVTLLDKNGSVFTFSNGAHYRLAEASPPEGFYPMEDRIGISVNESNELLINGTVIGDGVHMAMGSEAAVHGSWVAELSGDLLTFKIYDEKMPPTWTLTARKFGSQAIDVLAMAGARFTLYKLENPEGVESEREVAQAVSSDGTDGYAKGTIVFTDSGGLPLKLDCDAVYLLRETYAPLGYALMADIRFEVNAEGTAIKVTRDGMPLQPVTEGGSHSGADYDSHNRILTLSLVDETVYRLPEAGGRGMGPLAGLGILMMCSCGIFSLLLYHKKEIVANNKETNSRDRRKGEGK